MSVNLPPSPRASPERRQHVEEIITSLIELDPLRIIVFGSWARGQADDYSDLDIVVVMNTDKRFLRRLDAWEFLPRMGVDILVYRPDEIDEMRKQKNPFIEHVLAEGIVVYARPERMAPVAETG